MCQFLASQAQPLPFTICALGKTQSDFDDGLLLSNPPLAPPPPPGFVRLAKLSIHPITVAILAQGTSWAVTVTQAFLTQVRFPLCPGPWRVWFSQIPESLRLLNSGSFFPLDFFFISFS